MLGVIARVVVVLFVIFMALVLGNAAVEFIASKNRQTMRVSFAALVPPYIASAPSGQPETQFHAGQRIFIHLEQERKQTECVVTRSMRIIQLINDDTFRRIVWQNSDISRGAITLGRYSLDLALVIPSDLSKGQYDVEIVSDYACDDVRYYTTAPLIPFEVV
jgi:hypothetical protein